MRRFVLFLFPILVVLASIRILATVQRSETLRSQIVRFGLRDWLDAIRAEQAEIAEVPS